jgi:hypothetical protein
VKLPKTDNKIKSGQGLPLTRYNRLTARSGADNQVVRPNFHNFIILWRKQDIRHKYREKANIIVNEPTWRLTKTMMTINLDDQ